MIDTNVSHDKYVYHYTRLETFLERILPTSKLRLGLFLNTNDPRESKVWHFGYSYMVKPDFPIELLGIAASHEIKKGTKLLCLSMDKPGKRTSLFYGRGHQRPRMWAQYADNHRGVCLVFDREKLIETAKAELGAKGNLYIEPVHYGDKDEIIVGPEYSINCDNCLEIGVPTFVEKQVQSYYQHYFFRKHVDWQHEHEFRILLRNQIEEPEFVSISNSIKAVFLGADFPKVYEAIVLNYCTEFQVSVGKMEWWNGMPTVNSYLKYEL